MIRSVELLPKDWELVPVVEKNAVRVFSPSNIAVAKYWGKRDLALNLPTNDSVSITLKDFGSFTTVEFLAGLENDELILNGSIESSEKITKVIAVLNEVRKLSGKSHKARVQSRNNFPTAAGLASSASGLSAVALAAVRAAGLDIPASKISEIARRGSGSAARSIFGGFVQWKAGKELDGSDSVAENFKPASHWNLVVRVLVVRATAKTHASTSGMEHTRKTSPYFESWVNSAQRDVAEILNAIENKNFNELANIAESNCLRMHASAMAARPTVFYWQPQTLALIQEISDLRRGGVPVFYTIDAGPNVVCFFEKDATDVVDRALERIEGVQILRTTIGEGARVLS